MRLQRPLAQPIVRVFRDIIQPNLEVEMRTAGEAGHADEADGLTFVHGITFTFTGSARESSRCA